MDTSVRELQKAVESLHRCRATLSRTAPVQEAFQGHPVWEGVVHVFDLAGNLKATAHMPGHLPSREATNVGSLPCLLMGAIKSPRHPVRAAIVAEHRSIR